MDESCEGLWTQPDNIWIIYLFTTWNWHLCFVSKEKSWIVWQGTGKADYWTMEYWILEYGILWNTEFGLDNKNIFLMH